MKSIITRFAQDERGSAAVEYAMIAGIIALGIVASVGGIRDGLKTILNNANAELSK